MPREKVRVVGALSGDGTGSHFVASSLRKERLKKSRKELEEEANRIIQQADHLHCVTKSNGKNFHNKTYNVNWKMFCLNNNIRKSNQENKISSCISNIKFSHYVRS